jgi:hypothetical protein
MAGQIFKVSGRLLDRQTGASLEGLRVEALDSDLLYDDLVGSAITGSEGRFRFEFDETYFAEIFEGREPELFFRVYEQNDLLADPVEPIRWRLDSGETEIRLEIDRPEIVCWSRARSSTRMAASLEL